LVLACAAGKADRTVAAEFGVSPGTVALWRKRFHERRVDGLHDEPRSGRPRKNAEKAGRPRKHTVQLVGDEQAELERLTRRVRTNRHVALRAKLILASAGGATDRAVAARYHVNPKTVATWRTRFCVGRLEGLYDEPRPGAPRKIGDEQVEKIVVETLETTPRASTHWSTRKMAEKAGISRSSVSRIWRAHGLKPHVVRGFKLSNDPQFIEKTRDIVGLYMNPPDNALVFAFDEKPQVQALQRAQPILPMDIGMPERQTHNYIRHGTLDLFAALNVATGEVIAQTKKRHRAKDFVAFLKHMDATVPSELQVHLILDNLSAHKAPQVKRWLLRNPRFHLHFTPTYSSWLNLVERFFALLTDEALRRGSHTSIPQLRKAIYDYVDMHNKKGKPFIWSKTADEILDKIREFGERTQQVHSG
jgi:transposase